MKIRIWSLGIVALAMAASTAAYAGVHVDVALNPFGWGAPPVVYEPSGYYASPPVVYAGGGHWGDHRDHGRDRGRDHGRDGHHDGDRRH